jgi:hypothetical protein
MTAPAEPLGWERIHGWRLGRRQPKDGDQRMSASGSGSGMGDTGEEGEQLWWVGGLEWVDVLGWGQPPWVEDDGSEGTGFHRDHEALRTASSRKFVPAQHNRPLPHDRAYRENARALG